MTGGLFSQKISENTLYTECQESISQAKSATSCYTQSGLWWLMCETLPRVIREAQTKLHVVLSLLFLPLCQIYNKTLKFWISLKRAFWCKWQSQIDKFRLPDVKFSAPSLLILKLKTISDHYVFFFFSLGNLDEPPWGEDWRNSHT